MKKLLLFVNVFALMATTVFASFGDVNADTPYQQAINWMAENGVINGYGNGDFGPDNCVNRAEMLKMLFETLGVDVGSYEEKLFTDTPEGEWYAPYVVAARARGTVQGYQDGSFKPAQCVSRMEAIKMAVLEFNDGEIPGQYGMYGNPYDVAQMLQDEGEEYWWMEYFDSAMGANSVGVDHFEQFDADWSDLGVDSEFANPTYNFGPNESMTRKEVAEMMYRMKAMKDNGIGGYADILQPNSMVMKFDGCGPVGDYSGEPWYEDMLLKYEVDFLGQWGLTGEPSEEGSEGCFALDGSQFIFVPSFSEFGCGVILSYDVDSGWLSQAEGDEYCASEFGSRVGDYVEFTGWKADGGVRYDYDGKYFYDEDRVEAEMTETAQ